MREMERLEDRSDGVSPLQLCNSRPDESLNESKPRRGFVHSGARGRLCPKTEDLGKHLPLETLRMPYTGAEGAGEPRLDCLHFHRKAFVISENDGQIKAPAINFREWKLLLR